MVNFLPFAIRENERVDLRGLFGVLDAAVAAPMPSHVFGSQRFRQTTTRYSGRLDTRDLGPYPEWRNGTSTWQSYPEKKAVRLTRARVGSSRRGASAAAVGAILCCEKRMGAKCSVGDVIVPSGGQVV